MPIYQYKCSNCESELELLQSLNEPAPKCVGCKILMEKQFPTGTSFELKGKGWARDNYSSTKVTNNAEKV